jgi:hypothetical protein
VLTKLQSALPPPTPDEDTNEEDIPEKEDNNAASESPTLSPGKPSCHFIASRHWSRSEQIAACRLIGYIVAASTLTS